MHLFPDILRTFTLYLFSILYTIYPDIPVFTIFKTKPRNFEVINFSFVIFRNIRPSNEFISVINK